MKTHKFSYRKCGSAGKINFLILMLFIASSFVACTHQSDAQKNDGEHLFKGQIAPLLEGMSNYHYEISTNDTLVQDFFNQGLVLSYGFNHKEANRTFRQVAELDKDNPMAWWGAALVLGPNINAAMPEDNIPRAWEALQEAQELKVNGTQKERDYIEALSKRYAENPPEDRMPLDSAYSAAMGKLADKYPDDLDAQTLYAESIMDLHPWDYWKPNGELRPWTPEILSTLESVIERDPDHPGANHLYIHAVEAVHPEKALPSANRLRKLVPGAGHLVHMPSHIYIRTGDYHEGTLANERAVKADNEYVSTCRQQGIYPRGVWHYARGMAQVGKGKLGKAETELEKLKTIAADDTLKEVTIWDINTTQELMQIGRRVLEGEIEAQKGNDDRAVALLNEAIEIESQLTYNEPPDWFFPVRHNLGSVLLKADQPAEAELVYREDLAKFSDNGWSLYGLWKSLEAQNKTEEAAKIRQKFEEAWQYADVELAASRLM